MQMIATLVTLDRQSLTFEQQLQGGTPPYFTRRGTRVFLIDPEHWTPGSDQTPLLARYNEMPPWEMLDLSNQKPVPQPTTVTCVTPQPSSQGT